jgi:hypothetical protein
MVLGKRRILEEAVQAGAYRAPLRDSGACSIPLEARTDAVGRAVFVAVRITDANAPSDAAALSNEERAP